MWWNEQTPLPGTLAGASEAVPSIPARLAQLQSDGGQYVRTGGGPAAAAINPMVDAVRAAGSTLGAAR